MNFRIVNLGDYPMKITSFADARNSILDTLSDDEYVLWKSDDEELTQMLLDYLKVLKPQYPYYAIRRIFLMNGKYKARQNPDFSPHLVSNRVRYIGNIHETIVPRKPYGIIDFPIIHNHTDHWNYSSGWKQTRAYIPILALKKGYEAMKEYD